MLQWKNTHDRAISLLYGLSALAFVVMIIFYPEPVFQASMKGLNIWWNFVFPALLPFLILAEMMTGFGLVKGLGVLFEPFMRRFLRLPGLAGWAFAVGLTAGYPAGCDVVSKLTVNKEIEHQDAERIFSLSFLCNPMIMVAVIGAGFLHSPTAGFLIAIIHYISAFAVGLFTLPKGKGRKSTLPQASALSTSSTSSYLRKGILRRSAEAMMQSHTMDGRSFGKLLGDAVASSLKRLMVIGGFMIFFAVCCQVLLLVLPITADSAVNAALLAGIFEIHLGTYAESQLWSETPALQAAIIGAILGWGGLSLHAQAKSYLSASKLRYSPFFIARIIHGTVAFCLTWLLWKPVMQLFEQAQPSFMNQYQLPANRPFTMWHPQPFVQMLGILVCFIAICLLLSFIIHRRKRII